MRPKIDLHTNALRSRLFSRFQRTRALPMSAYGGLEGEREETENRDRDIFLRQIKTTKTSIFIE